MGTSSQSQFVRQKGKIAKLSAFTLIELLAVVVILGVLSGLLLASIVQSKKKARKIQCAANLHQLSIGLTGFVADNQTYPLFGPWILSLYAEVGSSNYTKDEVWRCPSARWNMAKLPQGWAPAFYSYNGYGLIAWGQPGTLGLGGHTSNQFQGPVHESEVAKPDDMIAIGDALVPSMLLAREDLNHAEYLGNANERHQGRANVAFCDGHAESPTLTFFDTDTSDAALARWNRDHQPHPERLMQ